MGTTTTIKTQSTILKWGTQVIGEVYSVGGFSAPTNKISLGSFADLVMKTRPGKRNAGSTTIGVNMNPDDVSQTLLELDKYNNTEAELTLIFPEGTKTYIRANARITGLTNIGSLGDIWKVEFTFKLVSVPVRSAS